MRKEASRTYIPAAGKDWRLLLYDPLCRLFGIDSDREKLIGQAALQSNHRVLDIGCGTGTLILTIKRLYPDVDTTGLDPDPKALSRAKRKTRRINSGIHFDRGFSNALPYPDSSFDRIFSSYMMHHINDKEKEATLFEVQRVLKPEGSFHLLDFERKKGSEKKIFMKASQYEAFMEKAGFSDVRKEDQKDTIFGRIAYYKASIT